MGLPITRAADERERPSRHGAILGGFVAEIAAKGFERAPEYREAMCATCAFRPGCMTNQMAATLLEALKCVLGVDSAAFACHHGMRDGQPTRMCAGFAAARLADFEFVKDAIFRLNGRLAEMTGPDEVRAHFDAWVSTVDPDNQMDDYERGRAYLRAFGSPSAPTEPVSRDASVLVGGSEQDPTPTPGEVEPTPQKKDAGR